MHYPLVFNEELEREDHVVKNSPEDYDAELESFREKATVQKTENEIHSEENTFVDFGNQPGNFLSSRSNIYVQLSNLM